MRADKRSLLSFGTFLLALLAVVAIFMLVPGSEILAQGEATISNLPANTCTLVASTRTCHLWAMTGTLTLPNSVTVPVWGFADNVAGPAQVPGPEMVANTGETLEVVLHNNLLTETMSLTFPGQMGVLADLDGVAAGSTVTYTIVLSRPGTFLYEAGMTDNGPRQVAMGLYGALVVRPAAAPGQAYDDPATAFDDEALLVLGAIDPDFNDDPYGFAMQNFEPTYWLINGAAYPDTVEVDTIAGNTILLRYVNATMRTQGMGLLGLRQLVIGSDGRPLGATAYGVVNETIASGQTFDTLTSVPAGTTTDTKFALYNTGLYLHNAGGRLSPGGPLAFGGMMTFLNTVTGTVVWDPGPRAMNVMVAPSPTTGDAGVTLSANLDEAATGGSNIVAAEYFVDDLGAIGTGQAISVPVPAPQVTVTTFISAGQLSALASGYRMLYVRGQDQNGTWGTVGAAVLNLDKTGPDSTGLNLSRDPSNGTVALTLYATGDDRWTGGGNVVAGQYRIDAGAFEPLTLPAIDKTLVEMSAFISTSVLSALPEGLHPVEVMAQDDLGNWGPSSFITITLDKTGPEAPWVMLVPDALDLTQPLTVTSVRLRTVMTDALSSGVQTTIANAEAFVDAAGPTGEGFDLIPRDGLFDEVTEAAYFDMPITHFSQLSHGTHTVSVHAVDAAGNWGPYGQATIFINRGGVPPDVNGPTISNVIAQPSPTDGAAIVTLTADAVDPGAQSNIFAAEWFINSDPGAGNGMPMQAADGGFNSPAEGLTVSFDVSGWRNAGYRLYVRAQDSAGNWGPVSTFFRLLVTGNPPAIILQDNFDTGEFDAWTEAVGAVSIVSEADLAPRSGTAGMVAALSAEPAYLRHLMPPGETNYHASFQFDPLYASLGTSQHGIFAGLDGTKSIFGIQVEASSAVDGGYEVRGWVLSQDTMAYTAWHELAEGGHRLGIRWQAGDDASFALVVDEAVVEELTHLDTSSYTLYEVRLGASSNLDTGISGVEYFDDFEARRPLFTYLPLVRRSQ